jgi:antitoxin component of MazEF toxin-antitoxin module
VVIPRVMRERVGLLAGGTVEVDVDGAAIRIEPVAGTEVAEEGGLLVIPPTGSVLDDDLVRDLRLGDQR